MKTLSPLRAYWPMVLATLLALSLAILIGGCASTPPPNEKLAVATAAVERANNSTTSENAPGELQVAISKLEAARQAAASRDHELAERLAEQAAIDAQVAQARAEAVQSRKAAQETQEAARVLREEIERKSAR